MEQPKPKKKGFPIHRWIRRGFIAWAISLSPPGRGKIMQRHKRRLTYALQRTPARCLLARERGTISRTGRPLLAAPELTLRSGGIWRRIQIVADGRGM